MSKKSEQVLAALKKLGPSSPTAIANETGLDPSLAGYHLRTLLKKGEVSAAGTSNDRQYSLGGGKAARGNAGGGRGGKKRKGNPARARAAVEEFIAAIDPDDALVCIAGGAIQARFTSAQTERIATLLLKHFE